MARVELEHVAKDSDTTALDLAIVFALFVFCVTCVAVEWWA